MLPDQDLNTAREDDAERPAAPAERGFVITGGAVAPREKPNKTFEFWKDLEL